MVTARATSCGHRNQSSHFLHLAATLSGPVILMFLQPPTGHYGIWPRIMENYNWERISEVTCRYFDPWILCHLILSSLVFLFCKMSFTLKWGLSGPVNIDVCFHTWINLSWKHETWLTQCSSRKCFANVLQEIDIISNPNGFLVNERLLRSVEHLEVAYAKWTWSSVLEQDLKEAKVMFQW